MRLIQQRAGKQVVRTALVGCQRNVPDRRDPQQCLDVRVVRLRLERVPEKHQQIDPPFGDPCADLLIATERSAHGALHRQAQALIEQHPGGAGRDQLMPFQAWALALGPAQQMLLAVIMGDQRDAFPCWQGRCGEIDAAHGGPSFRVAAGSGGFAECPASVEHAVGEAPLVVVPGHHFQQAAADLGVVGVEYGRHGVVVEIAGDQWQGVACQNG